jgi:hypothetical protein
LQLWRWTTVVLIAAAGIGFWGMSAGAGDPESAAAAPAGSNDAPALILQRESTRQDADTAPAAALPTASYEALSNSSVGLVEQPGVTEAGGVMVGLRGRFRTALILERKADGSTATRCVSNLPATAPGEH